MGTIFAPSDAVYWQCGHSTERDFVYVATANLVLFRRFYMAYLRLLPEEISDAVRRNFAALPIFLQVSPGSDAPLVPGQLSPCLSWTHRRLLRISGTVRLLDQK